MAKKNYPWYINDDGDVSGGRIAFAAIVAITLFIFFLIILFGSFFTIGPGEVGVLFDPLSGGIQQSIQREGLGVKPFWVSVYHFNTRTQEYTISMSPSEGAVKTNDAVVAVTRDGLKLLMDVTVWYAIDPTRAPDILRTMGPEGVYQSSFVRPAIRNSIMDIASSKDAADIYGEGRGTTESNIHTRLQGALQAKFIHVEKTMLRGTEPPEKLTASIELKKQAEQDALRMKYVLEKEQMEAQRKIIEAGGIAEANKIISGSLTGNYLDWYWIENLKNHNNVVYMIPASGGLPVFKDIDSQSIAPQNTPKLP